MNEQFVTKAIEKDRYLKATRLADRFESEILRELENHCKQVIEENRELFSDEATINTNIFENDTSLDTIRVEVPMNRRESLEDDSENVKFYLAIEWSEPEDRGESEPLDKSLCVAHYKIRPNPRDDYELVKTQTKQEEGWNIRFGDDIQNSDRGVCYIPISDGAEMSQALEELCEHFSTYGNEFGIDPQSGEG